MVSLEAQCLCRALEVMLSANTQGSLYTWQLVLLLGYILKMSRGMLQLRWLTMARFKYPHHVILGIGRISRMRPM